MTEKVRKPGGRWRLTALIALAVLALALSTGLEILLRRMKSPRPPVPVVTDAGTARQAALTYLKRKDRAKGRERRGGYALEEIELEGAPPENRWAFGLKNPEEPLVGGPRYLTICVISRGTSLERPGAWDSDSPSLAVGVPRSKDAALQGAIRYAWLKLRQPPKGLVVLKDHEIPQPIRDSWTRGRKALEAMAAEVRAPRVVERIWESGKGPSYTVSFCTYSPADEGTIFNWRFLFINGCLLKAETSPIWNPPRVRA